MPSSSSSSSGSGRSANRSAWQERLVDVCRECNIDPPVFQLISDKRGGRTAWSCRVSVNGSVFGARFWYDGKNIENANEDAAELALAWLTGGSIPSSPSTSRSSW